MRSRFRGNRSGRSAWSRRAGAVVEMAVVSPLLLGLIFGIVEYGWVFMLQSNLTSAAREACRAGILPGSDDADISARFQDAIAASGLTPASSEGAADGYHLQITRVTDADNFQTVTVTARVPWERASLVGGGIMPDPKSVVSLLSGGSSGGTRTSDMVASCTMMREGTQ